MQETCCINFKRKILKNSENFQHVCYFAVLTTVYICDSKIIYCIKTERKKTKTHTFAKLNGIFKRVRNFILFYFLYAFRLIFLRLCTV